MSAEKSPQERLLVARYSREACRAALHGEAVPYALGDPIHRLCTVRGIRYHHGFGTELRDVLPIFTRALNASSIMSDLIPDMDSPDAFPYCIWHPRLASEHTYRQLVARYPHMAYQVGRACAVAGYNALYAELDLLPDAHIAEEAREGGNFELFDSIMSQPARYSIMDDYERTVNPETRQPVPLNGDTAVRWMLDVKQAFTDPLVQWEERKGKLRRKNLSPYDGFSINPFDLTEDMNVDEQDSDLATARLVTTRLEVSLLSSPLPAELPTVQKDLLITMAAYMGDVDRYARLRRPRPVGAEITCCVRGIYHNTFFAIWWSNQPAPRNWRIEKAINARFIMNNVLSRVPHKPTYSPYLIWWPTIALPSTYRHLAKVQPDMLPQIIHATMYAGYKDLFNELLPRINPDRVLLAVAEHAREPHYFEALQARAELLESNGAPPPVWPTQGSYRLPLMRDLEPSANSAMNGLGPRSVSTSFNEPYDGQQCNAAAVFTTVSVPDAWRPTTVEQLEEKRLDYIEWPPSPDPDDADQSEGPKAKTDQTTP